MSMKIEKMETSSFWKGEAGVKGLVEDQAHTYKVQLYLKNDQVRDYSCTCAEGNSYRGICAHGEALFAYYKKYKKEALKPPIRTSFQAHAMIREYTNRAVADILEEEEGSQVRIEPVLFLEGRDIQAEFKIGRAYVCIERSSGLLYSPRGGSLRILWKGAGLPSSKNGL